MSRVAVIGGGFGGLAAAGELAKHGHAVTLFEGSDTLGGKAQVVSHAGVVLDTGPTLLAMPQVVREQFERLDATDLLPKIHRLELQSRNYFSDGCQFECWQDLEKACASAAELRAVDAQGLRNFYADAENIWRAAGEPYLEAPYEGFGGFMGRVFQRGIGTVLTGLKMSTMAQLAQKHFKTDHLQQFANRFATYTGASPYEASAAFAMIAHLERAFGVHHVEGGMAALVQALVAAVKRLGVTIHTRAKASWVKRAEDVIVTVHGAEERFDAVVVNQDPLATLGRSSEPLAMSGYVFHVDVSERLDLAHHTILFGGDYPREFKQLFSGQVPDDPTIYINHPAATDTTVAPPNRSGLFVMVNAPSFAPGGDVARIEAEWKEHAQRLQAFCIARLEAVSPQFKRARKEVFAERTPLDLAQRGAPGGSIYGFLPHGKFGPFRRPSMRGSEPGVYFAGGGTYPGGGVFMVMLSGRHAAGMANAQLAGRS